MPDFTNIDRDKIKKLIDAFKEGINEFLTNFDTLKEIYGENTLTEAIIDDALAVSRGQTTIAKIRVLHEGRKIGTKRKVVLGPRRDVSTTALLPLLPEFEIPREILGVGGIIPYFSVSMELTEIFGELRNYHHIGMIPISGREGIDIYRDRAKYKIPMEYFGKEEDVYGKRKISSA